MLQILKQEKRKKNINLILLFFTIIPKKWKISLDEASSSYLDKEKKPCLLIENKVELVNMEDDPTLKEFVNKNEFCGYFRFFFSNCRL